ncbi:hypothetical protein PFISCL1PPCAC_22605, partial [Pristionchus fissidentatus]
LIFASKMASTSEPSTSHDPMDQISMLSDLHAVAGRHFGQRQLLKELDERRQRMREAERELKKDRAPRTTWMTFGHTTTFIALPTPTALKITANDRKEIDTTIDEVREEVKRSANELLQKQGNRDLEERGFFLKDIHS